MVQGTQIIGSVWIPSGCGALSMSRFEFRACLYAPEDVLVERGDGGKGRESPTAGALELGPRAGGDRGSREVSSSMVLSCGWVPMEGDW